MSVEHRAVLLQHFTFLKNNIMVTGSSLLDVLFQEGVLDAQEVAEIRSKSTEREKVDELLKSIFVTSHEQYEIFLDSLDKADHEHVYDRLNGKGQTATKAERFEKMKSSNNSTAEITNKLVSMTLQDSIRESHTSKQQIYSRDFKLDQNKNELELGKDEPDGHNIGQNQAQRLCREIKYMPDGKKQTPKENQNLEFVVCARDLRLNQYKYKNKLELGTDEPDGHNTEQNRASRSCKESKDTPDGKKHAPKVNQNLQLNATRNLPEKINVLDNGSGEPGTGGGSDNSNAIPIMSKKAFGQDEFQRIKGRDKDRPVVEENLSLKTATDTELVTRLPVHDNGVDGGTDNSQMCAIRGTPSYECTLLRVIPKNGTGGVSAIAVVGNELFVARGKVSSVIDVFNNSSFAFVQTLTIPDVKSVRTLAGCTQNNCIYASDSNKKNIHRYDIAKKKFTNWSSNGDCYGLSVTRTHNVLATIYKCRQIQEYTTEGALVRTIVLDRNIVNPWHCIEVNKERFVLCWENAKQCQACIIDTSGQIIHSYGGLSGSDVGRMDGPRHIAIDEHGNTMIADQNNHRIVLLSPALSHIGYVTVPGQEMNRPNSLHLDELNGRMYIGELTGGRLFVLKTNKHREMGKIK